MGGENDIDRVHNGVSTLCSGTRDGGGVGEGVGIEACARWDSRRADALALSLALCSARRRSCSGEGAGLSCLSLFPLAGLGLAGSDCTGSGEISVAGWGSGSGC
jgi:hypothetical protein